MIVPVAVDKLTAEPYGVVDTVKVVVFGIVKI